MSELYICKHTLMVGAGLSEAWRGRGEWDGRELGGRGDSWQGVSDSLVSDS